MARHPRRRRRSATTTIPIVINGGDPVGQVWLRVWRGREAMSPAFEFSAELNTKRLEILKDAVPKLARVGLLRSVGRSYCRRTPTERAPACGSGTKAKIGRDRDAIRRLRFRERFQTAKQKQVGAMRLSPLVPFSPNESGSSSLPANTGCLLFTHRRSLSMRAVSCPMGPTTMTCSARPPLYVDKILKGHKPADLAGTAGDEV